MSPLKNNSEINITSIILCAGEGSRISDFIPDKPKPLLEINGKPILSFLISGLGKLHISPIIIITGHLKEQIEIYIEEMKQKNDRVGQKILVINSGNEYKKGPLYSFLSVRNEKSILKRNLIYLVLPGDTYFEFDLISEIISSIKNISDIIHRNSVIFYQNLQGIELKKTKNTNTTISIITTEEQESREVVRKIEQLKLNFIDETIGYKQIIPVFVFNFELLKKIVRTEKKVNVKTIREIINLLIKENNNFYAYSINPKYRFFDIDTELDLIRLIQKKKEDNRRSDYTE